MPESRLHPFSHVSVDSAGRILIPAEVREHLRIEPGQHLILAEDEDGIRLQTFEQAVKSVQKRFAPFRPPGVSVADDLIRDREEEARRENGE